MTTKQSLRIVIQKLFRTQNQEQDFSAIQEKVLLYIEKYDISTVCIYESISDEVSTKEIIDQCWKAGKSVYVPKIISSNKMVLINYYTRQEYTWEVEIFIIPWRAFNRDGKRLWRGKWYYDRFLSQKQYRNSKKVGICYDFQILEDIPIEQHDIPMDTIITT